MRGTVKTLFTFIVRAGISALLAVLTFFLVSYFSQPILLTVFVYLYPYDGQDSLGALGGAIFLGLFVAPWAFFLAYSRLVSKP